MKFYKVGLSVLFFLTCQTIFAQDPPDPPKPAVRTIKIEGPKVQDSSVGSLIPDGSAKNPFVFTMGSKGKLTLSIVGGEPDPTPLKATWNIDDSPFDIEVLPDQRTIWFPTDMPDIYHVIVAVNDDKGPLIAHAWFRIKGPNGPPVPEQLLVTQVKAGFVGPTAKADAAGFKKAIDGLIPLLESGDIKTTEHMIKTFERGLNLNGWLPNKYPGITKIFGDNFGGPTTPGHDLTVEEIETFKVKLKIISDACAQIK